MQVRWSPLLGRVVSINGAVILVVLIFGGGWSYQIWQRHHKVISIDFVYITPEGDLVRSCRVPLKIGLSYAWVMVTRPGLSGTWHERFELPSAPAVWPEGPENALSADHRTMVSDGTFTALSPSSQSTNALPMPDVRAVAPGSPAIPRGTVSSHGWSVASGDPAGTAHLHVDVDGTEVKDFVLTFYTVSSNP